MKICIGKSNIYKFWDVAEGDTFIYEGTLFLKVEEISNGSTTYDAVDLASGEMYSFIGTEIVEVIKCKIIEDKEG